jgi:AbrB family looped-hinge helix DNA binding protein
METILSSKGQVVLPAAARQRLHLTRGERLSIEVLKDGILLKPARSRRAYRSERHPISGLPRMVAVTPVAGKVTAAEIARLNAEMM